MQLTITQLSYTYEDAPTSALGPLSVTFSEGWTGIVGPNGSGKSTLLRILTGDLDGYTGTVQPPPQPAREPGQAVAYCAQATEYPPALAEDFALDYRGDAVHIRQILDIQDDWFWRFESLSHGERKRLQVAVVLWQNPPVLALDEPTNHVDAVTREKILAALREYRGVGLLVSHDRELLDELAQQCLFLRNGQGVMRNGGYTQGRSQEALEHRTVARERKAAKQELAHLHGEHTRRAHEAARADAKRSKKNTSSKDHDAKGKIDLARLTGKDGQAGRLLSQMSARVEQAEKRVAKAFVPKVYDGLFWLNAQPSKRRIVVTVEEGVLSMGEERSLSFPRLDIEHTDHIGITGPNGTGKSTFIRHLLTVIPDDLPTIFLPQELDTQQSGQILTALRELNPASRGEVLSLVARLNSDPNRILSGEALSPGELRKILLAQGMLQNPQLIIMDEPTNHLDLQSIEALEVVLQDCPCALVLVSHDAPFLAATAQIFWRFTPEGRVLVER